jgi:thiamine biosynthesis lipoprotein ApbE
LAKPSRECRALVEESQRFGVLSAGAFDISVQPLWRLYEAHFWSHTDIVQDIAARARDVARDLVDFRRIETSAGRIAFTREGMGITLNSVAQGFITDAIADLLRNESAPLDLRFQAAKELAPFVHSKLASVESRTGGRTHEDRLEAARKLLSDD